MKEFIRKAAVDDTEGPKALPVDKPKPVENKEEGVVEFICEAAVDDTEDPKALLVDKPKPSENKEERESVSEVRTKRKESLFPR